MLRPATFAHKRWYPLEENECRSRIDEYLERAERILSRQPELPGNSIAGLVPHAGWYYSATTTAAVFALLARSQVPETVLLLGSVHVAGVTSPTLWTGGDWETPLGPARIDRDLNQRLADHIPGIETSNTPHIEEHSIEVQVPFVRYLFPEARIAALMIPPVSAARRLGSQLAHCLGESVRHTLVIATTDMTHYGPWYDFTPHGSGAAAHDWVRTQNDRRMITLIENLDTDAILEEANTHQNACSAGPIQTVTRLARDLGSSGGTLVHYTTSAEVTHTEEPDSFVGYAGFVF